MEKETLADVQLDTATAPPSRRTKPSGRRRKGRAPWSRQIGHALWAPDPANIAPRTGQERLYTLVLQHLLPLFLYSLIAVLATYPLILHFGSQLPSDGGDALQNYWNYWWTGRALASGQNPYWTPYLYAPYGAPLYLHTLNLFNGVVSLPVQWAFGLIPAYNSVVFLSFILAGYFAYLLVAEVSGSRLAGFVGGIVYAFGSYHMTHLLGHMNLLSSEWLPAYILCLIRASGTIGRRRTRYALAAVGALVLLMFCDWQYVIFAVLFTLLYAPVVSVARRSWSPFLVAAAIGIFWAILAAPLIWPTIMQVQSGTTDPPTAAQVRQHSADLLAFVTPSQLATLWQPALTALRGRIWEPDNDGGIFLGFLPLLLAAVALWRDPRRARPWALAAALFALLALGPTLQVAGADRGLPLPYTLFQYVPFLSVARVPDRLSLIVTLCLAILAGIALVSLARRFDGRIGARARVAVVGALVAVLLLEHLAIPFPLEAVSPPPFYQQLAASGEPGTVLELPYCKQCSLTNYRQTVHEHPTIGGYISRRLAYPIRESPLYRELSTDPDITPAVGQDIVGRQILAYADVRWLVVFRAEGEGDIGVERFLTRFAEPTPLYQDAEMTVYRPLPPTGIAQFLAPLGGWHPSERAADTGTRFRWLAGTGSMEVWTFAAAPREYTLRFDTFTYQTPRRVEALLDGQSLGIWQVTGPRTIEVPLALAPGAHRLEFRSLDPPTSPATLDPASKDDRALSIAIANLTLAER
jgi:hypothetical protein